jgi:dTMP kinase
MDESSLTLGIWKEIAGLSLSPSHNRWHVDRVLGYANELAKQYGGDLDVITAAVILHDLGRDNPSLRGPQSSQKSAEMAENILRRSGFPSNKIENVITAIGEHDQPDIQPSTLEGRILKDSDFLAGFGPWGILRIALWAGETRGGIEQILNRLEIRMPNRLEGLEFRESKRLAKKEMAFSRLFRSMLNKKPELLTTNPQSFYIVLEGISGSGKDTQSLMLKKRLSKIKRSVLCISEPTDLYKKARKQFKEMASDPVIQTFLLMADRYCQINTNVSSALQEGKIIISVRSYLSTIVYQATEAMQQDFIDFFHQFVPVPDIVFILDLSADIARKRIENRSKKNRKIKIGSYESLDSLTRLRSTYLDIVRRRQGEDLFIIHAEKSIEEVNEEIWQYLIKMNIIPKKSR